MLPPPGRLVALYLAPRAKAPMQPVLEAVAVAGRGLVGDRYHAGRGAMSRWPGPHREVTLVSEEALSEAAVLVARPVTGADTRRNLLVRGVELDVLVGQRFRIGEVVLEGVQRCHPCAYLERVVGIEGLFAALKGRGGLRARIVEGGVLRAGDTVVIPA
jgi:MOSC domain-containing protein YiiM